MKIETITLCLIAMVVTSCSPNKRITESKDFLFFEVSGNVKEIIWSKSKYDFETQGMEDIYTTTYIFNDKGILLKLDEYDAFVEERIKKTHVDFRLGFFRGKDGYINKQSFTGGMSQFEEYKWSNNRVSMIDYICYPIQEEIKQYLKYDTEGRLSSANCVRTSLNEGLNEKTDSFVVDYEYIRFDDNDNWIERKGRVNKKLYVHESRKITYE